VLIIVNIGVAEAPNHPLGHGDVVRPPYMANFKVIKQST